LASTTNDASDRAELRRDLREPRHIGFGDAKVREGDLAPLARQAAVHVGEAHSFISSLGGLNAFSHSSSVTSRTGKIISSVPISAAISSALWLFKRSMLPGDPASLS